MPHYRSYAGKTSRLRSRGSRGQPGRPNPNGNSPSPPTGSTLTCRDGRGRMDGPGGLAIRAELPVSVLADAVHAYPAYGEAIGHVARELASTLEGAGPQMSESYLEKPGPDEQEQARDV